MINIDNIEEWKNSLGLLPMKLFQSRNNSFILLNGGSGDFCLEYNSEENEEYYYSAAWSSNTKNFITIKSNQITIFNWKENKTETIDKNFVKANYLKFYLYLQNKSYKSSNDIAPFVLSVYRGLRNEINETRPGKESLNLLFLIFAVFEEKKRYNEIDRNKWGLNDFELSIRESDFNKYLLEFSDGIGEKIKPQIELIVRHSSGVIFQEAHKEALLYNKNYDLFSGTISKNYSTKKILYSSQHYTPQYLARTIVENALSNLDIKSKQNLKILDPACGTSEFLLEALKQLKNLNYNGTVELNGWDSSEIAINTSRFVLNYEKREWNEKLNIKLKLVKDSLQNEWDTDYDLILMNPPFLSWEQLSKNQREDIKSILKGILQARPNLAASFLYKATKAIQKDGVIGSVIPSSILVYDSYINFRDQIEDEIEILLLGKLGNFIFENAFTDISILVGKKNNKKGVPLVIWTKNEKGISTEAIRNLRKYIHSGIPTINEINYSIYKPIKFPIKESGWKIVSFFESEFYKKLEELISLNKLTRMKNIFDLRQGIRSGANKVFKISLQDFNNFPSNEKKYFRKVIDNSSIVNGAILNYNYIWYPYDDKELVLKNETELKKNIPEFFKRYLKPNKRILIDRARKNEKNWWTLSEHRAWGRIRNFAKIVSAEFGKHGSYAFDDTGEFVIERGHAVIPKKEFNNKDEYFFYLTIFSSPIFDNLLSIYSRQLAGGNWYNLSPNFTNEIPLPQITNELKQTPLYNQIVNIGKKIHKSEVYDFAIINNYLLGHIYPSLNS